MAFSWEPSLICQVTHAEWLHYFVQLGMSKGLETVDELTGACVRARSWTRA